MKCEEKVDQYCMQAIQYKRYAKVRRCNKCCIGCMELCGNLCDKALELKNNIVEGESHEYNGRQIY